MRRNRSGAPGERRPPSEPGKEDLPVPETSPDEVCLPVRPPGGQEEDSSRPAALKGSAVRAILMILPFAICVWGSSFYSWGFGWVIRLGFVSVIILGFVFRFPPNDRARRFRSGAAGMGCHGSSCRNAGSGDWACRRRENLPPWTVYSAGKKCAISGESGSRAGEFGLQEHRSRKFRHCERNQPGDDPAISAFYSVDGGQRLWYFLPAELSQGGTFL